LPQFDITIAGEINLDLILYGLPADLPVEQELLARDMEVTLGSSSAITAHNLAVFGSRIGFITRVGPDQFGAIALERLRAAGVDLARTTRSAESKTGLTVLLARAGPRHILTYPGCMAEMSMEHLDTAYLKSARHFHLSSYFLHRALVPQIPDLLRDLRRAGLTISLDTNDDPAGRWSDGIGEALAHVDVLMPNEREACKLAGVEQLENAADRLLDRVPLIVVKRGAHGATAFSRSETVSVKAIPIEVIDPVGAGDSFNAGFLHRYVQGKPLAECLSYGNLAAACSATRPGGTEAFREAGYWQSFFASNAARS
jgi:sugar/nucleoside kinase (ribokinase family)